MYVCMCIYIYIYTIYMYIYTCMHTYIYLSIYLYIYTPIHIYINQHIGSLFGAAIHACKYEFTYIYICIHTFQNSCTLTVMQTVLSIHSGTQTQPWFLVLLWSFAYVSAPFSTLAVFQARLYTPWYLIYIYSGTHTKPLFFITL